MNKRFQQVLWQHKKTGGLYRIVFFSVRESDLVPLITYTQDGDDPSTGLFTRTAAEFLDGRFVTVEEKQPNLELGETFE